jgi:rsbT co-antagonist protein RsbR
MEKSDVLSQLFEKHSTQMLDAWTNQLQQHTRQKRLPETQIRDQCQQFLRLFQEALARGQLSNTAGREWDEVRGVLAEICHTRARSGFSSSETASFVFSLKTVLFDELRAMLHSTPESLVEHIWQANNLLDQLGLFATEVYQKSREEVIVRQQQELLELSTPVVQLWDNILALPLIGTLDSSRTQVVMESLLEKIVETGASIAIIDITGVPTVDTLVAQHLLKTVAAARLMGADCIISGIRPQIAQTIVHLGVDLTDVTTKATLADAFVIALKRTGSSVNALSR